MAVVTRTPQEVRAMGEQGTDDFLRHHRATRLEPITERLVAAIVGENPGYGRTQLVPLADLRSSCHDNVDRVLQMLAEGVGRSNVHAPASSDDRLLDAARSTGQQRAEQGLPLDDVLRSYRIGGRLIWDDLVAEGDSRLDAEALREIGTWLWRVVDATSAAVADAYHAHERFRVRADEQQRAELWEGLLGGRARDARFARDAGQVLDLPVDDPLLVVAAPQLDLAEAERRLAPHATAWVRRAREVVGLVVLRDDDPADALAALDRLARGAGVPVGVSAAVPGLGSADDGLRQAALAQRAQGATPGAVGFDDLLPEVLLLRDSDVADRLLATWVDPLVALGAEGEVLLDTLAAWVGAAGSASRAAEVAHCHRNTVLNRLHRVAVVTGRSLVDDVPPIELDLALRARRLGLDAGPGRDGDPGRPLGALHTEGPAILASSSWSGPCDG